jgi:hypothetical protein
VNSSKVIIYGRVESIQSFGNNTGIPYKNFRFKTLKIAKGSGDGMLILNVIVQQIGKDEYGTRVEADGDPLMKVGEEFVLFLTGGEGSGLSTPYGTSSGPWGRFKVVAGTVAPSAPYWPQYKGMKLDQFLNEIDNAMGVKSTYKALWEGKPEITNETIWSYRAKSVYNIPEWLIETWGCKISMRLEELRGKGLILYSVGYAGDGRIRVGMATVSNENVNILLETIRGDVPPGVLIIGKDSPVIPLSG